MKIQYLGTGAAEGWPAVFCGCENCRRARKAKGKNLRSRQQALIDDTLLMDFGPDTYFHILKYGLDFSGLRYCLLTHAHTDHFYPQEMMYRGEPYGHELDGTKLNVYGDEKCQWLFLQMLFTEDDSRNLRSRYAFHLVKAFDRFAVGDYQVTALPANHDPKEDCLFYSIQAKDGKRYLYAHDTGYFTEDAWKALEGVRYGCVSLDGTLGKDPWIGRGHMGLAADRKTVERMREIGCADQNTKIILSHFSHNGALLQDELEEQTKDDGFVIAWDGMTVEI